ncbi:MAG: site-2 protease family protein [Myxococcota bacterium]|nr:site-2 protease family protein [Myxococcota bacterium]
MLFIATCFTVATMHLPVTKIDDLVRDPGLLLAGVPFAATLMSILAAHEMGHYLTARRNGVRQTLPYFIPAPTRLGTLGALLFLRSKPPNRGALLDIAVMGPYAGLVLAIPAVAWGLAHSVATTQPPSDILLGDSLLFGALRALFVPEARYLTLHPMAEAGWYGLFITSLNLIPAAQLDGGHVTYAMFGRAHGMVSLAASVALLVSGALMLGMDGLAPARLTGGLWVSWAALLLLFSAGHAEVADRALPLSRAQRVRGIGALVAFALTFIPVPFFIVSP